MAGASNPVRYCRRFAYVSVSILLLVSLVRLGGELQRRAAFPWDLLTCFESPHLAALIKLRQGVPLYGPASDADSEPYPPLTAWLTYATLKPIGYELDIRGARGVAIGITLLTTVLATAIIGRILKTPAISSATRRWMLPAIGAASFLMLHRCLTSDQPHPDNLHILHAIVLLPLCLKSAAGDRIGPWIAAALWASLGILTKQTAAFAPLAVVAMLLTSNLLDRRRRRLLLALTLVVGAIVVGWLFSDPARDFHLRTALGAHSLDFSRLGLFFTDSTPIRFFPRVLLLLIAMLGVRKFFREPTTRSFAFAWGAIGFFEVLPAIAGFIKLGGNFNNLGIIDFWLFLIAAPYLLRFATADSEPNELPFAERRRRLVSIGATIVCCWFVGALWPNKLVPNEHAYRLCRDVEQRVRDDVAAGRRIWLTAGLAFRLRAGDDSPPRDLGIALWTLENGPSAALESGIRRRLADGYYDRVYDFFPWDLKTRTDLDARYEKVATIRGAGYSTFDEYRGIQPFVNRCTIYDRKR
ncbi:MAG: glycosyltransferase family 39 protein [Planctomycetia bacterium]|nr:glycosyltransferase family 39 protein [Planctomycetia bacterium]